MENIVVRRATQADAAALLSIYAPYVRETSVTFEYDVPTEAEFAERIGQIGQKYPYLAAVCGDEIVGYAYAAAFKTRAAYAWAVETTIYVHENWRGMGVGSRLYAALEECLRRQNITNMNACITYPNPGSIAFHEQMGFKTVAHFSKCGFKLGRWHDMVWMEKHIAEHEVPPGRVLGIEEIEF